MTLGCFLAVSHFSGRMDYRQPVYWAAAYMDLLPSSCCCGVRVQAYMGAVMDAPLEALVCLVWPELPGRSQ